MSEPARRAPLRVLYLVAGHDLVPTAGPTRNALSLARAWSGAELTLAFRRLDPEPPHEGFALLEIDPGAPVPAGVDDAAIRGMSVAALARYLLRLRRFLRQHATRFDVLLEKSWLFSGLACRWARARGLPGVVIENVVRVPAGTAAGGWKGALRHRLVQARVARELRRTPVIAETEELRQALVEHLGLSPANVSVVGLGVDHALFRPLDRDAARRALGLPLDRALLLYFGAFDRTHDLAPALAARAAVEGPDPQLHLLGDGLRRAEYEELARRAPAGSVRLHGRVPHEDVPRWIAACDLALAPYDPSCFPSGRVAYSTLKIPEAMACARPVASVPSGNVKRLIEEGRSGLLLENTSAAWTRLFRALPARSCLDALGLAAREAVREVTWERTAAGYQAVVERLLANP